MRKNSETLTDEIVMRQTIINRDLGLDIKGLIVPIDMPNNEHTLFVQKGLIDQGYLVGAIRQPTVEKPIIRFIPSLNTSRQKIRHALALIKHNKV
jgi:8-amino-7-oxononanoate synthase